MLKPMIYFTVSMWERMEHFDMLLEDLKRIFSHDHSIALHVVDFCTVPRVELQVRLDAMPFLTRAWQASHEFCNGMGHNICLDHIDDETAIAAVIAVDLHMPPDITTEIRKHANPGKSFYGPMINYECQDGSLRQCTAAYALIAAGIQDVRCAGRLRQNMQWGGDKREGGEDIFFMKQLKTRAKLQQRRPFHEGLICRWHSRNVKQRFYSSFERYNQMPWWDLVDDDNNPIAKEK